MGSRVTLRPDGHRVKRAFRDSLLPAVQPITLAPDIRENRRAGHGVGYMGQRSRHLGQSGLLGLGLCIALAACVLPGAGGKALSRQKVLGGAVTMVAPQGYCVEPASLLERDDTALVLMGRCSGESVRSPAVLTAIVGTSGSGAGIDLAHGGPELARYFRSPAGRQALSRRGKAADVTVHQVLGIPGAFLLHLTDRGPGRQAPTQPDSWRAVLPLAGRLVTLTVTGPAESPMSPEQGRALIESFVAATVEAQAG